MIIEKKTKKKLKKYFFLKKNKKKKKKKMKNIKIFFFNLIKIFKMQYHELIFSLYVI